MDGFINTLYPLWIGILLAFILYPIVKKIENLLSPYFKSKKIPKYLGILTSLLAFIAIISLIIYGLTSLILGQVTAIKNLLRSFLIEFDKLDLTDL